MHMRATPPQTQNAMDLLGAAPELGEQIARIHEVGALPRYGGTPPGDVRASGAPYNVENPISRRTNSGGMWGEEESWLNMRAPSIQKLP